MNRTVRTLVFSISVIIGGWAGCSSAGVPAPIPAENGRPAAELPKTAPDRVSAGEPANVMDAPAAPDAAPAQKRGEAAATLP
jgi:hypothetical protein